MPRAVKAADLRKDPRVAIHGPTHDPAKSGSWRGEAKVAGRAVELASSGDGHAFQIDIADAVHEHVVAAHRPPDRQVDVTGVLERLVPGRPVVLALHPWPQGD